MAKHRLNFILHFLTKVQRRLQKWLGASTAGVRTLVLNEKGEVLLVRHTYSPGWHFPGGGIKPGESPEKAARREAYEETGIETQDALSLIGVYYHQVRGVDDYVMFYIIHSFVQHDVHSPEIAEHRWSDPAQLPPGTTRATRSRLSEYLEGFASSDQW